MDLSTLKDLFNEEFKQYIGSDYSKYVNKLFEYCSKYPEIADLALVRQEMLQKAIINDVAFAEDFGEYCNLTELYRDSIYQALDDINNYLFSKEPYDAMEILLKGDINNLITVSEEYSLNMRKEIATMIENIKNKCNIEMLNHKLFNEVIADISYFLEYDSRISFLYSTMHTDLVGKENTVLLHDLFSYVNDLQQEASIISKFDNRSRTYISSKINNAYSDLNYSDSVYIASNICKSLLLNYTLLSFYSDHPDKVIISDNILKAIMMEVNNNSIDKEDVCNAILNGPIKFSAQDIQYINENFINKIFNKEEKKTLSKGDLINIVR